MQGASAGAWPSDMIVGDPCLRARALVTIPGLSMCSSLSSAKQIGMLSVPYIERPLATWESTS